MLEGERVKARLYMSLCAATNLTLPYVPSSAVEILRISYIGEYKK